MKFISPFVIAIIFLISCDASDSSENTAPENTASAASNHSEKPSAPSFTVGEPYGRVREALLATGWMPATLKSADVCAKGDVRCTGRPEMAFCSGFDLAPCKFIWRKGGYRLSVFTVGMDAEEGPDAEFEKLTIEKEQTTSDLSTAPVLLSTPKNVAWKQAIEPCLKNTAGDKTTALVNDAFITAVMDQTSWDAIQPFIQKHKTSSKHYKDPQYDTEYTITSFLSDKDYLSYYVSEDNRYYICLDVSSNLAKGNQWFKIGQNYEEFKKRLDLKANVETVKITSVEGYDSLILHFKNNRLWRYVFYNTYYD